MARVQVPTSQLECLIGPQMTEVVGVFVAAADREHASADHVSETVNDACRVAPVRNDARTSQAASRPSREASSLRSTSVSPIEGGGDFRVRTAGNKNRRIVSSASQTRSRSKRG